MIIKTVRTKVKSPRQDKKRSEDRKWRDIQLKKLRAEKYSVDK